MDCSRLPMHRVASRSASAEAPAGKEITSSGVAPGRHLRLDPRQSVWSGMGDQSIHIVHLLSPSSNGEGARWSPERVSEMREDADGAEFECSVVQIRTRQLLRRRETAETPSAAVVPTHVLNRVAPVDPSLPVRLARLLRRIKADIVHTHDLRSHLLALTLQPLLGFRLVATAGEETLRDTGRRKFSSSVNRQLLSGFDRVIAVNNELAMQLCRLGCRPAQVDVIQEAIDTRRFARENIDDSARSEWQMNASDRVVGIWPEPADGAERLRTTEMFSLVCAALGPVHAVLFETSAASRPHDDADAETLGADTLRRAEPTPEAYAALDALVVLDDGPGTSRLVLEAQSMEVPVIVASLPSMQRLIESGRTGIVAESMDSEALAAALVRLLSNPREAAALAAAARLQICQRHAPGESMRKIARTYRRALAQA